MSVLDAYFRAVKQTGSLASIYVNLTTTCNLDCRHCYRAPERTGGVRRDLPLELLDSALDDAKELGALWVTFSGGEPLLHPEWKKVLQTAVGKGFAVSLSTNATLIDEQTASFLADLPLYMVKTTLLGMTAEVHDGLARRVGSFRKVVSAIELLRSREVNVTVSMTAMSDNIRQIPDFVTWAKSLGAVPMVDPHLGGMLDGRPASPALRADDEDLRWLLTQPAMEEFLDAADAIEQRPEDVLAKDGDILCSAGHYSVALNADGSVWPCVTWPLHLGSLRDKTLAWIWRESHELAWVRSLRQSRVAGCVGCKVRHACFRCPGMAAIALGDALAPLDESCRIARIKHEVTAAKKKVALLWVPGLGRGTDDDGGRRKGS